MEKQKIASLKLDFPDIDIGADYNTDFVCGIVTNEHKKIITSGASVFGMCDESVSFDGFQQYVHNYGRESKTQQKWDWNDPTFLKIKRKGMIFTTTLDIEKFQVKYELKNRESVLSAKFNLPKSWQAKNIKYLQFGVSLVCTSRIDRVRILH